MIKLTPKQIRKKILELLPEDKVVSCHNEKGHFYSVDGGPAYPSVTGKLQILKDESIINFKMNRAIDYIYQYWPKFTEVNVMEHLELASRASADIFEDAGDIGSEIHDYRAEYFDDWILTGKRPQNILSYIPSAQEDIRAISALRALKKFIDDYEYVPIASELKVYSHKLEVAGTLDDIGMIKINGKKKLLLLDIKTSNQFKDHYFFQVALYYVMFYQLTGIRPDKVFILKLSKKDGTYQLEDLKRPSVLATYTKAMIRVNEGLEYIKSLRRDNQKNVIKL